MVVREKISGALYADVVLGEEGKFDPDALGLLTFLAGLLVDRLASRKLKPAPALRVPEVAKKPEPAGMWMEDAAPGPAAEASRGRAGAGRCSVRLVGPDRRARARGFRREAGRGFFVHRAGDCRGRGRPTRAAGWPDRWPRRRRATSGARRRGALRACSSRRSSSTTSARSSRAGSTPTSTSACATTSIAAARCTRSGFPRTSAPRATSSTRSSC